MSNIAKWRRTTGRSEQQVPVDLRFVDMFMAAIGALIFLSLLLAFLISYLPKGSDRTIPPPPAAAAELRLLSRTLPPGRVDEAYEVAVAARGGRDPLNWEITAGSAELPPGISFDATQGIFKGTPSQTGTFSLVLTVQDANGRQVSQPYSIAIRPAAVSSYNISIWVSAVLTLLLLLMTLASRGGSRAFASRTAAAEAAHRRGQPAIRFADGRHGFFEKSLPEGIEELRSQAHTTRRISHILLVAALLSAAYSLWAWFG